MERVNRILSDREYRQYLQNILTLEKERPFCGHDLDHLLTVARLTYLLLLEERCLFVSKEIAYAAGLLHDIGRWKEYQSGGDHALHSAALAGSILNRTGFDDSERKLILEAIAGHRHDQPTGRLSPLGKALRKADDMARLCFCCASRSSCRNIDRRPQRERLIY